MFCLRISVSFPFVSLQYSFLKWECDFPCISTIITYYISSQWKLFISSMILFNIVSGQHCNIHKYGSSKSIFSDYCDFRNKMRRQLCLKTWVEVTFWDHVAAITPTLMLLIGLKPWIRLCQHQTYSTCVYNKEWPSVHLELFQIHHLTTFILCIFL